MTNDLIVDELSKILEEDWRSLRDLGYKVKSKVIPGKKYKVMFVRNIAEDYTYRYFWSVVRTPDKRYFRFQYAYPLRPDYDDSFGPEGENGEDEIDFVEVKPVTVKEKVYRRINL